MSAQDPSRQPAGVPIGGQFTTQTRAEPDMHLDAAPHPGLLVPSDRRPAHLRTPEAEAAFDAIWAGDANGFKETTVRSMRARRIRYLEALRAGTIRPNKIVGGRYPKGRAKLVAERYLTDTIAEAEADLATRGRSNRINQSNVELTLGLGPALTMPRGGPPGTAEEIAQAERTGVSVAARRALNANDNTDPDRLCSECGQPIGDNASASVDDMCADCVDDAEQLDEGGV
jgi:hypothetical protein